MRVQVQAAGTSQRSRTPLYVLRWTIDHSTRPSILNVMNPFQVPAVRTGADPQSNLRKSDLDCN
jgi:hypothetical protein